MPRILALFVLVTSASLAAFPIVPVITATASDRGIDYGPDGTFENVFNNPSVLQITKPPANTLGSEERTAVEFPIAALAGIAITTSTLLLTPQSGPEGNLGLTVGEVGEIWGYAGNGTIEVADMTEAGKSLLATIVGPAERHRGDFAVPEVRGRPAGQEAGLAGVDGPRAAGAERCAVQFRRHLQRHHGELASAAQRERAKLGALSSFHSSSWVVRAWPSWLPQCAARRPC